jgi:hypothetical protein
VTSEDEACGAETAVAVKDDVPIDEGPVSIDDTVEGDDKMMAEVVVDTVGLMA